MNLVSIDNIRSELLSFQSDILREKYASPYFYQFLQIGFLDFFFLAYANKNHFEHQDKIIDTFEKSGGFISFLEYLNFLKNESFPEITQSFVISKISLDELFQHFFFAMNYLKNCNPLFLLDIIHIAHNWNCSLLESIPLYWDYISNYVANPDVWMQLLDNVTDTLALKSEFDFYTVIVFFQKQMEFFPKHIQESILMNLGIRLGFPIYVPSTGYYNMEQFVTWIMKEVTRKKAQKRAIRYASNAC